MCHGRGVARTRQPPTPVTANPFAVEKPHLKPWHAHPARRPNEVVTFRAQNWYEARLQAAVHFGVEPINVECRAA